MEQFFNQKLGSLNLQIFDLFDVKRKGVIDFGDFVRSLNVFHPNAPQEDKIDCKFTWHFRIALNCMNWSTVMCNCSQYILMHLVFDIILQFHSSSMIWIAQDSLSGKRYLDALFVMSIIYFFNWSREKMLDAYVFWFLPLLLPIIYTSYILMLQRSQRQNYFPH